MPAANPTTAVRAAPACLADEGPPTIARQRASRIPSRLSNQNRGEDRPGPRTDLFQRHARIHQAEKNRIELHGKLEDSARSWLSASGAGGRLDEQPADPGPHAA